ncbi:dTDP-4-dehydrorhamnose reductase [Urechidicola sp. KH5]
MKRILVTGASGQLGKCIQNISNEFKDLNFLFTDREELDITNIAGLKKVVENNRISHIINCAAYTAVDLAESNEKAAVKINSEALAVLAKVSSENDVELFHISTDFVFDGAKVSPYLESDTPNPLGVYGSSKLRGELAITKRWHKHFIIRTSWLYSEFGNNFMKTMLRLGFEREELGVVSDQFGAPTYAKTLAKVILTIIVNNNSDYGLFHFSNKGETSWYGFAKSIFELSNINIHLSPIKTEEYPTPAKRPAYSVLNTEKIQSFMDFEIPHWHEDLKLALNNLERINTN